MRLILSFLNELKNDSATALSQQLPRRLMLGFRPWSRMNLRQSSLSYCDPWSEWIVKKFTGDGIYLASIERPDGIEWGAAFGIAVDESGNIFFTDQAHAKVWKYRPEGR